jgi:transcriptional regulator with XRE-family HTH domain
MARRFSELTKEFSPERRQRIEAMKNFLREDMKLAELREVLALSQAALAAELGVKQAEISKIERRTDMLISTLSRLIRALGGELEIRAVFPDRAVRIQNFSSLHLNALTTERAASAAGRRLVGK